MTTTEIQPLTGKDQVWREFVTFTSLNELVADSARIIPSRAVINQQIPETYFVFVEVADDDESQSVALVADWARAMGATVEIYTSDPLTAAPGRRWYSACGSVAGIRLSVHSPMYDRTAT